MLRDEALNQRALAHASLAGDQHELAGPRPRLVQATLDFSELVLSFE